MGSNPRQLLGIGLAAALVALALGCQTNFGIAPARQASQAFVLVPSDTPSAQESRSKPTGREKQPPSPAGKPIFRQYCAGCHGQDGRGGSTPDGQPVPDLVTFGAQLVEPFIYDPAELSKQFSAPEDALKNRFSRAQAQLTALEEGQGDYAGRGKKVQTPRHWYEAVSGDIQAVSERLPGTAPNGTPWADYHLRSDAGAGLAQPEKPITTQQRWDAVAYLWSLSADIQLIEGGGNEFQRNCNVCHGRKAIGDGFNGERLEPRPRNFTLFEWSTDKTNQRWFESIQYGRVGTGMPAWEHVITPDVTWQIIEYLRTFTYETTYRWVPKAPF